MKALFDTSVLVAATLTGHPARSTCLPYLQQAQSGQINGCSSNPHPGRRRPQAPFGETALDLDDRVTYNYTRFTGIIYEGTDLKMKDLVLKQLNSQPV